MANFLDKTKVTTGIDKNTDLDLSCVHITTGDWMNGSPVYIKELVPGEKIDVVQQTFTRMDPMVVPTFGRGSIHNRAFFVPFRTIFREWNNFITSANSVAPMANDDAGTLSDTGFLVSKVPYIKNSDLVKLFTFASTGPASNVMAQVVNVDQARDIELVYYTNGFTNTVYPFKLTDVGRRVLKILESLGYKVFWAIDSAGNSNPVLSEDPEYSAMPILAWFKIINDWYYPSQYVGDNFYNYTQSLLTSYYNNTTGVNVGWAILRQLFASNSPYTGLVNYDSDYFVSAFDNPVGPSVGIFDNVQIQDITSAGDNDVLFGNLITSQATYGNGVIGQIGINDIGTPGYRTDALRVSTSTTGAVQSVITQYGLDSLKALTDYVKRHQLVGARALDRFYARFGKSLSSEKMDRCNYIGGSTVDLQIGDVMAHADSGTSSPLGSYAGKGVGFGDLSFDYNTDEYGYIIIISSIVPKVGYYQGVDRTVMHVGRLDFWTPEFDQMGNQAIAAKELYLPMRFSDGGPGDEEGAMMMNNDLLTGIFGYTPRYSEYKIGRDRLTGDFNCGSLNNIGNTSSAWHLFRNVGGLWSQASDIKHSRFFDQGSDWSQYNRIFANTSESNVKADKFYLIHSFGVHSASPMHSLYDTYKFENEGEGAKTVVTDVNGVKVN